MYCSPMRIHEAVAVVKLMAEKPEKYGMRPEEAIALLVSSRFIMRVLTARSAIRSLAEAVGVDLNQEELFK